MSAAAAAMPATSDQPQLWRRGDTHSNWDNVVTHSALPRYQLRSKSIDGVCDAGVKQMTGYLDTEDDKHFFYWFFEAKNKVQGQDSPLVVWLNGGPGCSSMSGLLTELGPCLIAENGTATKPNPYGWNENANIIFIDQPTNVGFSYGTTVTNTTTAAQDFVALLQLFYKTFPEYLSGGLHVFGESYGGHYIPAIGAAILDHNDQVNANNASLSAQLGEIPLHSIGVGNGLFDQRLQYKYYSKMACNSTYPPVFKQSTCDQMDVDYKYCSQMIDQCKKSQDVNECTVATGYCLYAMQQTYVFDYPKLNPYDVRIDCAVEPLCYADTAYAGAFLNQSSVQEILHAKETNYQSCSTKVQADFLGDFDILRSFTPELAKILEAGIPSLIYVGDADWICNWYGVKATLMEMDWAGQTSFNSAQDKEWVVKGNKAGQVRTQSGLSFVRVYEAGHMVPMDQPENALDMLNRWLSNSSFA
ncbi:hypothetical protein EV183_001373 [Coemansia sp. RSA 2336]|nr:hypothetical protein EV183_001373 [Coemansia sp. RSA 2336]